jgi:hypothetical protein
MNLINISDHPTLKLKRKVSWHAFSYNEAQGEVKLYTICHHFLPDPLDNTKYGESYTSNAIKDFEKILSATNNNQVNPVSGLTCTLNDQGVWIDLEGKVVDNPVGEFTLFTNTVFNQPIIIATLIESIIQRQDFYTQSYN